ncbi:MAG: hypothetical protein PHE83_17850 [Opitutaceae bacterium]|nr:hypothetical protein [Opitutaceae bacterium]
MNLREIHWLPYFLFWVALLVAAGALLGALLFPLAGLLFRTGDTPWQLVQNGARIGGFYFLIWAPGTAVVLCVMRSYRRRHPEARPPADGRNVR